MARIRVVSSFYNEGWHVRSTLDAIFAQQDVDLEVVGVDDGSSDDTLEHLRAYEDKRLRVLTQGNQGLGAALRLGFGDADTEYLAYHEAGDAYAPDRLSRQIALLEKHPEAAFASCYSAAVGIDDSWRNETRPEKTTQPEIALQSYNPFPHSGTMYRRSAYDVVGGYRGFFRNRQDLDLLLRLTERFDFVIEPNVLVTTYRHAESVSVKPAKRIVAQRYRDFAVYCAQQRQAGQPDPLEAIGPGAALLRPRSRLRASEFAKDALRAAWRGNDEAARVYREAADAEAFTLYSVAAKLSARVRFLPKMRQLYFAVRKRGQS